MVCDEDVRIVLLTLAESVGMRLREERFKGYVIEVSLRATDLQWMIHQRKIKRPTDMTREILDISFELYKEVRRLPLRGIGVRVSTLVSADEPEQMSLFVNEKRHGYQRSIDRAVDAIRGEFGFNSIQRGLAKLDEKLGTLNAREEHMSTFQSSNTAGLLPMSACKQAVRQPERPCGKPLFDSRLA